MSGYIAWDIVDQTLLQPRSPLWGGYLLDWGVAGLVGLTSVWVAERWRAHVDHRRHDDPVAPRINPAILEHIASSVQELDAKLNDLNDAVGAALGDEGPGRIRHLRHAMIAIHHAQSLNDEIAGLAAAPRQPAPPPPEQLVINS
jgi:hypothetical protein